MATKPKQQDSTTESKPKRENQLLKARHAAVDRLIAANREQFESFYVEEAKTRGVEYTPPLTDEQRARQQFEKLLADNPSLAEEYLAQRRAGVAVPEGVPSPVEAGDLAQG